MWGCIGFALIWVLFILIATYYNHLHRQKYEDLIAYLNYHHPDVASRIEIKPLLGFLYPSRGAFTPSIRYARKHEPLDDPVAEELLAEYARFSRWGIVLGIVALVLFAALIRLVDNWMKSAATAIWR